MKCLNFNLSKFLVITLVLFINCTVLSAGKYYVANTGSNLNSGSLLSPWLTIQYSAEQLSSGDSLIVKEGNYEGFYMYEGGSKDNPITIYGGGIATIQSASSKYADGINLEGASFVVIDGFTITNDGSISRAGIRSVANEGVVIRRNRIIGMGKWGIFTGFSENIIIEKNLCSNSEDEHGIYFSNSADNPVIRYNECFDNKGCGIHMNGDISMGNDGIISNALVEGNIIYNNSVGGGSGINCDGVQNSIFQNNLLYNNHASGISFYRIDGAEASKNNVVVNNTVVMPSDGRWAMNIRKGSINTTLYNNIFFTNHSFRGILAVDAESISGLTSDYNIFVDRFSTDGDETVISLSEWRTATGQDANSILSTPDAVFASATENNYRLKADCIAIDAGTPTNAPTVDLSDVSRPFGSGIDIGAYEKTNASGIRLVSDEASVLIFPNPTSEFLVINSKNSIQQVDLLDINGRLLAEFKGNDNSQLTISLFGFRAGAYILQIHSKGLTKNGMVFMK